MGGEQVARNTKGGFMHMRFTLATVLAVAGLVVLALAVGGAGAVPATEAGTFAFEAPGGPQTVQAGSTVSCEAPTATIHCYTPADIRSDYGVDGVTRQGGGANDRPRRLLREPDGGGRSAGIS